MTGKITRSQITAGFLGSSSGMPCFTFPTRSAKIISNQSQIISEPIKTETKHNVHFNFYFQAYPNVMYVLYKMKEKMQKLTSFLFDEKT